MNSTTLAIIAVIVVAALAGGLCYAESRASSGSSSGGVTVNIEILGGVGNGTVDEYSPNTFTVKQGQNVTLAVLSTDDNTHGLVIQALGVDTGKILPGHTDRVSFIANQTGTFEYLEPPGYCTGGVGNHCNSVQHMTGNVSVLP